MGERTAEQVAQGLDLALDAADVSELFPFALVVDRTMCIVGLGPSLARIKPDIVGLDLHAAFELHRPSKLTFEDVASGQQVLAVLAARNSELTLRGQFRLHRATGKLLFVGSPWVTSLSTLETLGLTVSDFASHEPVADMLHLMQAQVAAANEAKTIGDRLDEQRRELERTLRWLTLQYAVSDALLTSGEDDIAARILSLLCQSTEWQAGAMWLVEAEQLRAAVTWRNGDAEVSFTERDACLPCDADALVADVWRSGVPNFADADTDGASTNTRYACPIFGPKGGSIGVLEMGAPQSKAGMGTAMAISEVGIKLGMYLERERAHTALMAAKEQAEAGTRAKSEFLANMSHELRTPLNGMLGTAQLLSDCELPPAASRYVKALVSSGNNLLAIINDLLDLAKIEAGKTDLELQDCDPLQVLEEAVEHFRGSAQGKRLLLIAEAHCDRHVRCDPLRLRQVLWNLMGNAIKFTSSGFVRVVIREHASGSPSLLFEVQDSGIGVAAARASQLFTPFEQADPSVTRSYGGTGLGLAICKRLVSLMQGDIGLRSQEGTGSTFWFTLPSADAQAESVSSQPDAMEQEAWVLHRDPVIRDGLHANVVRAGFQALAFASCEALLAHSTHAGPPACAVIESTLAHEPLLTAWLDHDQVQTLWYAGWNGAPIGQEMNTLHGVLTPASVRRAFRLKADQASGSSKPHTPVRRPAARSRGMILLVEDNAVNQLVASAMLMQLGYGVEVASSGQQCLALLPRARYAAVLMDCQMPELDGFDTTRLIRRLDNEAIRSIPVIALTAGARETDRQQCIDAGMDDFLSKPLQRAALEQMLARWVAPMAFTGQKTLLG